MPNAQLRSVEDPLKFCNSCNTFVFIAIVTPFFFSACDGSEEVEATCNPLIETCGEPVELPTEGGAEAPTNTEGGESGEGGEPGAENTEGACSDGFDNDDNGYVDCDDFDCNLTTVCGGTGIPENTEELCSDGQDNDKNTYTDCDDFACAW